MKLFKTSSIAVIKDCCRCFGFQLPSELLEKTVKKFMSKRNFCPCTRLLYGALCTTVGFFTPCLYFCSCMWSINVSMTKDWDITTCPLSMTSTRSHWSTVRIECAITMSVQLDNACHTASSTCWAVSASSDDVASSSTTICVYDGAKNQFLVS